MEINEDTGEQVETTEQVEETERTDWKAKAIELEAKYKADIGSLKRELKDLRKPKTEAQAEPKPQDKEVKGFDYGQLAYLTANGVNDDSDVQYLEGLMKESGMELKALLGKQWVQAELKERKDLRMSEQATSPSGKRGQQSARDSVDYWIAKGELPPPEQVDLRRKVVNEKIAREKAKADSGFGTATEIKII